MLTNCASGRGGRPKNLTERAQRLAQVNRWRRSHQLPCRGLQVSGANP